MTEDTKQRIIKILIDDPALILLLKNKYIDDELWEFCLEREPSLFEHIKDPSIKMCNYALELDGNNLKYILNSENNIKITRKMIYIAITSCPKVIIDIPPIMLDEGLKEFAFDKDPSLMQYFDNIRSSYIKKRIKENPSIIQFIKNPDDALVEETLKYEPNILLYFDKITPNMFAIIEEYYPYLIPLINKDLYT